MHWIETLWRDVRYALRTLRKNLGFTATIVLSLALGIGVNTAIFSLIDAVILRWLPVHEPQELVQLRTLSGGSPSYGFSYPVVQALAEQTDLFAGLCGFSGWTFHAGPPESAARKRGMAVTGGYYETLGLTAAAGRLLTRDDDQPGVASVAVISHRYWESGFSRDPRVIGQPLLIEGIPVPIVGVSPAGFTGPSVGEAADITITMAALPQLIPGTGHRLHADVNWLRVLARLLPGISQTQLNDRLAVVWPPLAATTVTPTMSPNRRRAVETSSLEVVFGGTGWSALRGRFREPLYVLMGIVSLILLIACANAANLMLSRAGARQNEIALRQAMGATRRRIIRQLLTESVLLSFFAAAIGIALAYFANRLLLGLMSEGRQLPIVLDLRPDWSVVGFTSAVAVATGILFGLSPALRITTSGANIAVQADSRAGGSKSRLASSLVVIQVAFSLVLLIGAGLFVGTLGNLANLEPGFGHEGVLLVGVDARRVGYNDTRLATVYQELLARIQLVPGVASASLSGDTPLSGRIWSDGVIVEGQPSSGGDTAHFNRVAPGYFQTMRTALLIGRDFTAADDTDSPAVAIVSETFVRRYLSGIDPLGRRVSVPGAPDRQNMEIVGVVRDTLSQSLREPPPPAVYMPYFQHPQLMTGATFEIRAVGSLAQVASSVRQELATRLPLTFAQVRPLTEQVEASLAKERILATLTSGFGLLALVLASVGLYGLLAYSVGRRTREIGVRMALGAGRNEVVRLVLSDVLRLLAVGGGLGLVVAWATSRLVSSMLFGLTATDLKTALAAIAFLVIAGLLAGILPACRASQINPSAALKFE